MRIVAVVSQAEATVAPAELAAFLASGSGADVVVLCIADAGPASYSMGSAIGPGAETMLLPVSSLPPGPADDLTSRVRAATAEADRVVSVIAAEGAPRRLVPALVAETSPDLLVLPGVAPRGRLAAWLLGDDWGPLAVGSLVPVVLAREGRSRPDTVLVVLEDVRPSGDAIRALAHLPLPRATRVVLLGLLPGGGADRRVRHRRRMILRLDAARSMLTRTERRPSVLVQESADLPDVLATIERLDAGLVVIASSHLGGRHRLSSLAEGLVRRSDRSVLVVPTSVQPRRRAARGQHDRVSDPRAAGSRRTAS